MLDRVTRSPVSIAAIGAAAAMMLGGLYLLWRKPAAMAAMRPARRRTLRPERGWWQRHDLRPARFDHPQLAPDNLRANDF